MTSKRLPSYRLEIGGDESNNGVVDENMELVKNSEKSKSQKLAKSQKLSKSEKSKTKNWKNRQKVKIYLILTLRRLDQAFQTLMLRQPLIAYGERSPKLRFFDILIQNITFRLRLIHCLL